MSSVCKINDTCQGYLEGKGFEVYSWLIISCLWISVQLDFNQPHVLTNTIIFMQIFPSQKDYLVLWGMCYLHAVASYQPKMDYLVTRHGQSDGSILPWRIRDFRHVNGHAAGSKSITTRRVVNKKGQMDIENWSQELNAQVDQYKFGNDCTRKLHLIKGRCKCIWSTMQQVFKHTTLWYD